MWIWPRRSGRSSSRTFLVENCGRLASRAVAPGALHGTFSMVCCGCCERAHRGQTCRGDIRPIKRATDGFSAGSPTELCPRFWRDFDATSKHEAGSRTWRATSTGPTFRQKKGGPRRPLSGWECHKGHGNRRPRWSSTRSLSCERKPIRQCAHRRNSRRCFRGQATSPLNRG